MSMPTLTRRPVRSSIRLADTHIRARRTFHAGNLTGVNPADTATGQYRPGAGAMPYDWAQQFYRDTADGLAYVVFSYATPIAWVRSDGLIVVPPVNYSVTTGRHQYEARAGLDVARGKTYRHDTLPMSAL